MPVPPAAAHDAGKDGHPMSDEIASISSDEAQRLLLKPEVLSADEVVRMLRYLKRSNDDLVSKLRQLKNEIGRVGRR